ncbi:MAG: hypothetical protein AB1468_04655 [Candidatus Micrarchaeota archaeon]
MDLKINEKRENPIFNRTEVRFTAEFDSGTPSRKEVKELLAGKLGAEAELVVIDEMVQEFGKREVKGYAKAYKSRKSMEVEREYKMKRDAGVKEGKKEAKTVEKPKPAPKAEAEAAQFSQSEKAPHFAEGKIAEAKPEAKAEEKDGPKHEAKAGAKAEAKPEEKK